MDCAEFMLLNNTIKEDIEKGHSFYMIVQNNPEINTTERTLYNYQECGYFTTKNIDLPRKVRYKKRKRYVGKTKKNRIIRIGRTYKDFQEYIANNSITHFVELDTVEGVKGKECLLTMAFIPENFLLTFKMKKQNSEEVSRVFTEIKSIIGYENFYKYFNIILTDNGSEFTNVLDIENNSGIIKDSKVFFCDPYRSDQKAGLEVTHSYIRRYIETGQNFTKYTNNQILDMTNNINSANREKHDGKTPYEKIIERIDVKILDKFGYKKINSKDVILNGRLGCST